MLLMFFSGRFFNVSDDRKRCRRLCGNLLNIFGGLSGGGLLRWVFPVIEVSTANRVQDTSEGAVKYYHLRLAILIEKSFY